MLDSFPLSTSDVSWILFSGRLAKTFNLRSRGLFCDWTRRMSNLSPDFIIPLEAGCAFLRLAQMDLRRSSGDTIPGVCTVGVWVATPGPSCRAPSLLGCPLAAGAPSLCGMWRKSSRLPVSWSLTHRRQSWAAGANALFSEASSLCSPFLICDRYVKQKLKLKPLSCLLACELQWYLLDCCVFPKLILWRCQRSQAVIFSISSDSDSVNEYEAEGSYSHLFFPSRVPELKCWHLAGLWQSQQFFDLTRTGNIIHFILHGFYMMANSTLTVCDDWPACVKCFPNRFFPPKANHTYDLLVFPYIIRRTISHMRVFQNSQ